MLPKLSWNFPYAKFGKAKKQKAQQVSILAWKNYVFSTIDLVSRTIWQLDANLNDGAHYLRYTFWFVFFALRTIFR